MCSRRLNPPEDRLMTDETYRKQRDACRDRGRGCRRESLQRVKYLHPVGAEEGVTKRESSESLRNAETGDKHDGQGRERTGENNFFSQEQ